MSYLLIINSINWNKILDTITWTEVIIPGLFTLAGATIGALLAGKYAVNAVKNQLKYDKQNKRIDMLDNHLKISTQFISRLKLILEYVEEFESNFLPISSKKNIKNQEEFIKSINRLKTHIEGEYDYLKSLPILNLPYDYYISHQKSIYFLESILIPLPMLEAQKKLINLNRKTDSEFKKNLKKYYDNFIRDKKRIEKIVTEIDSQHEKSYSEYRKIEKSLGKIKH